MRSSAECPGCRHQVRPDVEFELKGRVVMPRQRGLSLNLRTEKRSIITYSGKLYAGKVRCVAGEVSEYSCRQWYDVFLAGPPCQPWSRRADAAAMGFRDDRAEPFIQCCRILAELLEVNRDAVFMFENMVVAPRLQDDEEEQERLPNWKFETINAMDMGAPQSRPRRVAQDLVEAGEWEHRPPVDPNLFLERLGSWVTKRYRNACWHQVQTQDRPYT